MCGSGTLLIEAALIARNIAPGIYRKGFAFEKWANFDADLFEDVYNDDSRERDFSHKIYGSDAGFYAVQTATKNIQSANLQRDIEVRQIRVEELRLADKDTKGALVMMNPPYGERLSQDKDVVAATKNDKKMEAGVIKFILLDQIGHAYIDKSVSEEEMEQALSIIME